jgi:hypothetical protein
MEAKGQRNFPNIERGNMQTRVQVTQGKLSCYLSVDTNHLLFRSVIIPSHDAGFCSSAATIHYYDALPIDIHQGEPVQERSPWLIITNNHEGKHPNTQP